MVNSTTTTKTTTTMIHRRMAEADMVSTILRPAIEPSNVLVSDDAVEEEEKEQDEPEIEHDDDDDDHHHHHHHHNFFDRGDPIGVHFLGDPPVPHDHHHHDHYQHPHYPPSHSHYWQEDHEHHRFSWLLQEPSFPVRAAWRTFLESSFEGKKLRLEQVRLRPACVQFLCDRISWLPLHERPQRLVLSQVTFVEPGPAATTITATDEITNSAARQGRFLGPDRGTSNHFHQQQQQPQQQEQISSSSGSDSSSSSSSSSSRPTTAVPEAARLMASCLLLNAAQWTVIDLEDNINHPRWTPNVCHALLQTLPHITSSLQRLRLRGLDFRHYYDDDANNDDRDHSLSALLRDTLVAAHDTLQHLELESCRFSHNNFDHEDDNDDRDWTRLVQGIAALQQLQSLTIYECGMDEDRLKCLVQQSLIIKTTATSSSLTTLKRVLLYDNTITATNAFGTLARLLHHSPQLEQLKVAFGGHDHNGKPTSAVTTA